MYADAAKGFANPEVITTHFHLREGDSVADFGAGSGHYILPLSQAVGRNGKVFLCEIQRNLVDALGNKVRELRLSNVRPLWCDLEAVGGIKLRDGELDAGILSNTLFQFSNKGGALTEIARVIRKGGKLCLIDWSDSFGNMGPRPQDVIQEEVARQLVESAGFVYGRSFPAGDHHYGLAFRRQ